MSPAASRVLVVDDTPANLSLLLDALTEAGHEILVAESGRSALSLLEHTTPDLVLMDLVMPGMDGITACRKLKERPDCRDVPVIFMTAIEEPAQKLRAFEAGALDYITKPVYPPEVLARVAAHLQIRALQRNLAEELALRIEAENQLSHSLDRAVLLADAKGRIVFATRLAADLLHKHFPSEQNGYLPATLGAAGAPLIVRRFSESSAGIPPASPLGARESRPPSFPPVPAAPASPADDSSASAPLQTLLLEERGSPPGPASLTRLGVTAREAEVLYWIAQGKSNPDIATILGANVRTVHKHVEHIFQKLGVETRNAAMLAALDILRPPANP